MIQSDSRPAIVTAPAAYFHVSAVEMLLTTALIMSSMLKQGTAREGRCCRRRFAPDLPLQVLRGGACVQLRMVRRSRLPLPGTDIHLMGVLGVLQVRDGAAAGVGHEGPWPRRLHTRLVHGLLLPLQSPHLALLRHRQHLLWLCVLRLPDHADSILGVQPVQRQDIPHLLLAPVHVKRHQVRHPFNCQQSVSA